MNINIYKKNIYYFEQFCPYLDIPSLKKQSKDIDASIIFEDSAVNCPTAKVKHKENFIYLHSRYNPIKEAENFFSQLKVGDDSVVLIFGGGLFYQIKELIKKSSEKTRIIVIEPNFNIISQVINHIDISDLLISEKIYFIINKKKNEIEALLKTYFNKHNIQKLIFTKLVAYESIFSDEYLNLKSIIDIIELEISVEINTIISQGSIWQKNAIHNIQHILNSYGVSAFIDKFKGIPAIIVAAGPSLSKNIHLLQKMKNKVFIISTYTALNLLYKNNVEPDIVVTTDGRQLIHESVEALKKPLNIPLLYISPSDFRLLAKTKAQKIFGLYPNDKFFKEQFQELKINEPPLYVSGTVTATILDFVTKCGCDPIVFIGQDLAFTEDKIYADASYLPNEANVRSKKWHLTEDVYGGQVYTHDIYEMYKKILEKYIAHDKTNRIYIDASEGGAKINGTKIETLDNICKKYLTSNTNISVMLNSIFTNASFILDSECSDKLICKIKDICENATRLSFKIEENLIRCDYLRITARVNYNARTQEDIAYMNKLIDDINKFHNILQEEPKETLLYYCYDVATCTAINSMENFNKNKMLTDEFRIFAWEKLFYYRSLHEIFKTSVAELNAFLKSIKK